MTERFDFNKALKAIQSGQAMSGKDGVLAPLVKQLTEEKWTLIFGQQVVEAKELFSVLLPSKKRGMQEMSKKMVIRKFCRDLPWIMQKKN